MNKSITTYSSRRVMGAWRSVTYSLLLFTLSALLTACSDDNIADAIGNAADNANKGTGEMVMFTVGTTENSVTRAGAAKTYYMPHASRFVCRMYYKAQTGSTYFDVTGGSDQTAWLKVSGNVGDSKYWNWKYLPVNDAVSGKGGVDKYGNDFSASAFYWQNREEHAFLAWTDLNRATSISGGNNQGDLKFVEDSIYRVHTKNITSQWIVSGYQINGVDDIFDSQKAMEAYVQKADGSTTKGETIEFKALQEACPVHSEDWSASTFYYRHGLQHKWSEAYADTTYLDADTPAEATKKEYKWVKYLMFFDKVEYAGATEGAGIHSEKDDDGVVIFLMDGTGKYLAAAEPVKDSEGRFLDKDKNPTDDPEKYTYNYYQTDESGNIRYDESNPLYTFYFRVLYEKKDVETVEEYPALAFDLTRKNPDDETMTIASQPDIVQALERQAPTGATQESNRVNLYFKHQFSQIQVNVKNAADNSVSLDASDIKKVELLGVTKKGYVFTEINKTGTIIRPTTYEDIDFSQYTENDLKANPYGTAFKMFVLPASDTELGYLKSFNAIAFGQLQAIRITWAEKDRQIGDQTIPGIEHAATYRIPKTDLINLKSGVRYVWNIELRRGTLAIIRTEIVDWELPKDENHNGATEGTIQN